MFPSGSKVASWEGLFDLELLPDYKHILMEAAEARAGRVWDSVAVNTECTKL